MRKNVAGQKIGAQLVSATDGSAFTGSVTVSVTGDAGTQATGSVGSGACTHEGGGYHSYSPGQSETNYDLIAFTFAGSGAVPVTVQIFTRHDANLTAVQNDEQSATDLKDFADAGYDPATNKVEGVKLVDTLTTYTSNTPQTGDSFAIVNSGTHGNAAIKGFVDDIGVAGAGLTAADDAILSALATAQTSIDDLPTNAELATSQAAADDATLAAIAALVTTVGVAGAGLTGIPKTGYKLAADGADLIVPADPSAIPVLGTASIVTWIGYFGAWTVNEVNSDANSIDLRNSADNADLASHPTSDNGTVFSSGEAA